MENTQGKEQVSGPNVQKFSLSLFPEQSTQLQSTQHLDSTQFYKEALDGLNYMGGSTKVI